MSEPTHPLLQRYGDAQHCLRLLERSRRELLGFIGTLSEEALFTRRLPEQWSPAEELEHIALVEESGGKVIRMLRKVAGGQMPLPPAGPPGQIRPDGRFVAPAAVEPRGGLSREELLERLRATRERLQLEVAQSQGLLEGPPTFQHPFFGELTALGWLQTLVYSEQHHLEQLRSRLA